MPQMINTNVASLNAQRNLNASQLSQSVSLQRLSSGLRINGAKDDAAGLAVSQRMSSQIKSLNQAARNANDGISMLQTAEGAMGEMQNMLQRMKELGTQAANGTIGDTERGFIATEVGQLQAEIDGIGNRTEFNGQKLLTGALSSQLDPTGTVNAGFAAGAAAVTSLDVSRAQAGKTFTFAAYTAGDNALTLSDGVVSQTVSLAAIAANGSTTLNFDQIGVSLNLASVAGETADNIGGGIDTETIKTLAGSGGISLQIGSGTTVNDKINLSFGDVRIASSASLAGLKTALTNFTSGTATQAEATALMSAVDGALDFFSTQRATIGAVQNRLETTVSNVQTTSENLSASRSRIQDADYASETASLTRANILQQAGTAMLAQANALPNNVMALLRG
jgi:flagellin